MTINILLVFYSDQMLNSIDHAQYLGSRIVLNSLVDLSQTEGLHAHALPRNASSFQWYDP